MSTDLNEFVAEIRACQLCKADMERAPRPILQVSSSARILIAGQAPGNLAMESGRPFTDPSGVRLRDWLQMDEDTFYNASKVAIVPMGFCFPGYDKNGGDIPPMKRCAETWRQPLLERLPNIGLTILIGGYAQKWHIGDQMEKTLTATVQKWQAFLDQGVIVTPHPSWRNNAWLKRNPWFETDLLPELRKRVRALLS
ncbi:MAG: uracil-DNA glycosylase family protein [Hyphomicrobiales bacterium]|nr:uracil-DNA glycosylase family protein [Hyphomicrobiales bacterium]